MIWEKIKIPDIEKAVKFEKGVAKEIHWYENIITGERVDFKIKKQIKSKAKK